LQVLYQYSFPTHNLERLAVPYDWEIEKPELFHDVVNEINSAADAVCRTYDDLVRLARNKLAV
jgi:hypothetical protein